MEQAVYVYQPAKPGKASGERPSKRRKVASANNREQQEGTQCFAPLLNGDETPGCIQARYDTYKQLWSEQEQKIQVRNVGLVFWRSCLIDYRKGNSEGCGCRSLE